MSLRNSPFAVKLQSNYVPSDEEILEIHGLLLEPLGELARLDTQIDETQSLKDEIDSYKGLTSLVRRLPQDILQEIFLSCLPTEWNATVDAREAPLLLGFICRYWRSVAHSMPLLWSGLHIDWQERSGFFPPPDLIDTWLNRASTCPLSISLGLPSEPAEGGVYGQSIINACHRIQHLGMYGSVVPHAFRPLLQLGAEDLPVLTSLALHTEHDLDSLNILQTPSLRHVSLESATDPLRLPLLWEQLTDLTIRSSVGVDFDGALEVLFNCRNLVQCDLHLDTPRRVTPRPSFAAPCLQHLTLLLDDVADPLEFLGCLSLPNLQHLAILIGDLRIFPPSDAHHFFVDLSLSLFTRTTLLSFLALIPRVTHLRLRRSSGPPLDNEFLSRLTPTAERPSHHLCPLLTHFQFSRKSCPFSDTAFLEFILGRSMHGPPLQGIGIRHVKKADIKFPELNALISEGLSVKRIYNNTTW
ncbi:hypothetical protein DFH09DRAFT_1433940 [Mycena vulgaris]|nr:hypothetical protein DFH09DRAFT_1433940 [Mycena vulgaris]